MLLVVIATVRMDIKDIRLVAYQSGMNKRAPVIARSASWRIVWNVRVSRTAHELRCFCVRKGFLSARLFVINGISSEKL